VDAVRRKRFEAKQAQIAETLSFLESAHSGDSTLARLLRRPEVGWVDAIALAPPLAQVPAEVARQVTADIKYSGYVARQELDVARQQRLAQRRIPDGFDYATVEHLRAEAREKLIRVRPRDLAQAGRISGITPADLAVLMVRLTGVSRSRTPDKEE